MTSKIKVDNINKVSDDSNIIKKCGTTITLGASGDSIALASGASQTGFGRTGTVNWQTGSIKTATFTAANGEGYFCNTTAGTFEMDLPAGSAGAIVSVQDYNNTFDSNALTVDPNGSEKINGGVAGAPITLGTEGQGVTFVYIDATVGWRSIQDNQFSESGSNAQFIAATGGTIATVCTNFKVHTFTSPGTFTVTCAGNACGSNTVDYLVVAGGGGGGGASGHGGGGGAGGYRESPGAASGCYSVSPLGTSPAVALPVTATGFPITVGAAGAAASPSSPGVPGVQGGTSTFSTISSAGGGGGQTPGPQNAGDGGSGGGAGGPDPSSNKRGDGNTPSVSPPQGNNGGPSAYASPNYGGGGGGGAGAAGTAGTSTAGGPGGNGVASSITGAPVTRAGGGGGSSYEGGGPNAGGSGGGGVGTIGGPSPNQANATVGTINTGGGGGGGESGVPSPGGKNGGSGIVVIRYKFQ
jgi:hypothetical protein